MYLPTSRIVQCNRAVVNGAGPRSAQPCINRQTAAKNVNITQLGCAKQLGQCTHYSFFTQQTRLCPTSHAWF